MITKCCIFAETSHSSSIQGSSPFYKTKFKDFFRTFHGTIIDFWGRMETGESVNQANQARDYTLVNRQIEHEQMNTFAQAIFASKWLVIQTKCCLQWKKPKTFKDFLRTMTDFCIIFLYCIDFHGFWGPARTLRGVYILYATVIWLLFGILIPM